MGSRPAVVPGRSARQLRLPAIRHPHRRAARRRPALQLAGHRRHRHGRRHLGDALHRHAGPHPADPGRLRSLDHRALHRARHPGRGRGPARRRPAGHHHQPPADRRHADGRGHRRHALHRHDGDAAQRPGALRPDAVRRLDRRRRPARRPGAAGAPGHQQAQSQPLRRGQGRRRRADHGLRRHRHALHGDGVDLLLRHARSAPHPGRSLGVRGRHRPDRLAGPAAHHRRRDVRPARARRRRAATGAPASSSCRRRRWRRSASSPAAWRTTSTTS